MAQSNPKTILFLGATGGCGLSALRRSLAAGHTCVALCRTPSNLTTQLGLGDNSDNNPIDLPPNLRIVQGDAHDADVLARCLRVDNDSSDGPSRLVDAVVSSIGARPTLRGMSDPHVCEKGVAALLAALRRCRAELNDSQANAVGSSNKKIRTGPHIVVVSSTGITPLGRDLPLPMVPLYRLLLAGAHRDKRAMEEALIRGEGVGEQWTIVRGSLFMGGEEATEEGAVRVGVEDPVRGVVESRAVGYTISREDVGKWIFENLIAAGEEAAGKWVRKAATVTY